MIIRSVADVGGLCGQALTEIFGADLHEGATRLQEMLAGLDVSSDPASYGVGRQEWTVLVKEALEGERGRNFIGSKDALLRAADTSAVSDTGEARPGLVAAG